MGRTGFYAHPATDAFAVAGGFQHFHIHLAGLGAFATGDALAFIHPNLEEGDPVEEGVEGAQGAEPLAEGTEEDDGQADGGQEDAQLPGEKLAQGRPDTGVDQGKGDGPFHNTLGAEVLTEEGFTQADLVDHENGEEEDHEGQDDILKVGQGLEPLGRKLFGRNFVQNFLEPAEGA